MTDSYRKTPIFSTTVSGHNRGEKDDKQRANRHERRLISQITHELAFDEDPHPVLPKKKELSNLWSFRKDGKRWWDNAEDKDMRK
jgi:mRNA-degrading endonuclease RelE of RelBE toxin-antitoxin system